eukprot:TRINITY_DN233_c1_g1_i3.p1 TRINITY_DN233_c1_g1~~TRINITY_DN233_c1_g1_i3.p1  ORF type:complete len:193 (+),score=43.08 TRINITY_DN233_c1_g1_i3:47-625(+)
MCMYVCMYVCYVCVHVTYVVSTMHVRVVSRPPVIATAVTTGSYSLATTGGTTGAPATTGTTFTTSFSTSFSTAFSTSIANLYSAFSSAFSTVFSTAFSTSIAVESSPRAVSTRISDQGEALQPLEENPKSEVLFQNKNNKEDPAYESGVANTPAPGEIYDVEAGGLVQSSHTSAVVVSMGAVAVLLLVVMVV